MELESKVANIKIPENTQRHYDLSGLGGSGKLTLSFAQDAEDLFIHVVCTAGLPLIKSFHFEALSRWEKTRDGLSFVSYEEKDFTKKIVKKWEFGVDGLNFIENKKGLVLEREVQYFKTPAQESIIFDPVSAATIAIVEKPERDICIFGKQRILHIKTTSKNNQVNLEAVSGVNPRWSKILNRMVITLNSENLIESVEIPAPLIGKVKMQFKNQNAIQTNAIDQLIKEFHRQF